MKRNLKKVLLITGILFALIIILVGSFWYVTECKYTDIDTQISPDGRCRLTLQMKGEPEWPFGSTYGRMIARYDGKTIKKLDFEIRDDGAMLGKENWNIVWGVAGVQVTLSGSEQEDQVIQIMYDGTEEFDGYSEEQITAEMEKRYGNVSVCGKEGNAYYYDTGKFFFWVQNDLIMVDNYQMEYYRYLTDAYFTGRNRAHEYVENGTGFERVYTPIIPLYASSSEEKEWFCSDVTNWLLYVMKELPYGENEELYQRIIIDYKGETFDYKFQHMQNFVQENIADVYNDLYDFVEKIVVQNYEEKGNGKEDVKEETEQIALTEETIQYYLSLEPDCSCQTSDGVEYRMIPVDRACGSSYYVLIATADGGKSVAMVNPDPYLGNGGGALWIRFLEDGKTGFSGLSYSGGAYGSLYRTEDGGRSFDKVEYPSAKVKLPDGTYYNPFVMPEKVYEKDGKLYMEAGQGADGDYYGEEGFCHGLYESADNGKTWNYVKEIAVKRT
ncbi:MAG: hypothetical protein PUC12_08435 [Clostridiales bacterium]|nr:hypothetical protein [Clostridiales bacterium]